MVLVIIDGQMSEENERSRRKEECQENDFIHVPSGLDSQPLA